MISRQTVNVMHKGSVGTLSPDADDDGPLDDEGVQQSGAPLLTSPGQCCNDEATFATSQAELPESLPPSSATASASTELVEVCASMKAFLAHVRGVTGELAEGRPDLVDAGGSCSSPSPTPKRSKLGSPEKHDSLEFSVVRTLDDIFDWPKHGLLCAEKLDRAAASVIAERLGRDTMSTSFSGIDAPGTARTMLHRELEERLGRKVTMGAHEWAIDSDLDCRRELECHPDAANHIFGDIREFWQPSVAAALAAMKRRGEKLTYHKLIGMVKSRKSVKTEAYCYRHQRPCCLSRTRFTAAGPPCTPFSSMGKQLKTEDESMEATMCWFAIILCFLFPVIFYENVMQLEKSFIEAVLGEWYDIYECPMYPENFGVPARRPRMFRLLVLKRACSHIMFPFSILPDAFKRTCEAGFRMYLFASDDELLEEVQWASSRPTTLAANVPVNLEHDSFEKALTVSEAVNLKDYLRMYPGSGKVFSLKQMAANDHAVISGDDALQTVTKNVGLLWDSRANRWYLPKELLASQGFPVPGSTRNGFPPCCSYQVDRSVSRSRLAMSERAGNSMNVNCCGYMHIYRLLCIELNGDSTVGVLGMLCSNT